MASGADLQDLDLRCRTMMSALEATGGLERFCAVLGVDRHVLIGWVSGSVPVPEAMFLKAVETLLDCYDKTGAAGRDFE
jgi:hypothetical protein